MNRSPILSWRLTTLHWVLVWVGLVQIVAGPASAHEQTGSNSATVHVSEQGFSPSQLTVAPGVTVIFENIGNAEHWPASDDHPSHTRYDGTDLNQHCPNGGGTAFDACRGIAPGDTWSMVFPEPGTYAYHDHLWPQLSGSITAQALPSEPSTESRWKLPWTGGSRIFFTAIGRGLSVAKAEGLKAHSFGQTDEYDRLAQQAVRLVQRGDPRLAIQALERQAAHSEVAAAFCHDVLHQIGRASFAQYGSFAEAIPYHDDFCNSGYIHGLFEGYFAQVTVVPEMVAQECDYAAGLRPFDTWQCHHGLGHGYMYMTGGDLDAALGYCTAGSNNQSRDACTNGVYMELFNREVLAKEPRSILPTDPFATCTSDRIDTTACYDYAITYFVQTLDWSYEKTLAICADVPPPYDLACAFGVGTEASKRAGARPAELFALCDSAATMPQQNNCASGVVTMAMYQAGAHEAGSAVCAESPERYRQLCHDVVAAQVDFFTPAVALPEAAR